MIWLLLEKKGTNQGYWSIDLLWDICRTVVIPEFRVDGPCNCISLRPKIWYGLYWIQVKKATLEPDVNLTISLFPRLVRVFSSRCNFNPIHGIVIFYNLELQFVRKKYLIIHWHVDLSLNFFYDPGPWLYCSLPSVWLKSLHNILTQYTILLQINRIT